VQQHIRLDKARQGRDFAIHFECVCHCKGIRVARNGNHVLGSKYLALFEDFAADLAKRKAIGRWIKLSQTSGILNWLKRHTAHARLYQSIVNYFSDFAIVEAFT